MLGGFRALSGAISCLPGLVCGSQVQRPNMAAWPSPSSLRTRGLEPWLLLPRSGQTSDPCLLQLQSLAHPSLGEDSPESLHLMASGPQAGWTRFQGHQTPLASFCGQEAHFLPRTSLPCCSVACLKILFSNLIKSLSSLPSFLPFPHSPPTNPGSSS